MTSTRYITTLLVMLATTGSHSQLLTTVQTVIGNGESSPVALVITEENGMADILSVVNLLKIAKVRTVKEYNQNREVIQQAREYLRLKKEYSSVKGSPLSSHSRFRIFSYHIEIATASGTRQLIAQAQVVDKLRQ